MWYGTRGKKGLQGRLEEGIMEKKTRTLGLALGAGGARGIAHVAFLKVLEAHNVPVSFISGSSMGAVVGGLYSSGVPVSELEEKALSMRMREIFDFDLLFFKRSGLVRGNKIDKMLIAYLGEKTFTDTNIPFGCVAVDVMTGAERHFTEGLLYQAIHASAAIPSVISPVKIGESYYVDGGILNRVPADLCYAMGADVVVAVDVLYRQIEAAPERPKNIVSSFIRTVAIMDREITAHRLKADLIVNVSQDEVSPFRLKNVEKSFEAGMLAAEQAVPHIKKLLEAADPADTDVIL